MTEVATTVAKETVTAVKAGELQSITPGQMIAIALEKGTDFSQLEKLMDMQERWERNEARKAFVQAMAQFKAMAVRVTKNRKVRYQNKDKSFTDYSHATLDHILEEVCPALSECGLSHGWRTEQNNGLIYVTCRLTHELGHSEETTLFGPPDTSGGKNAVQAIGSTTTYLQRYTFLAVAGLATADQDDDGAGGAPGQPAQGDAEGAPADTGRLSNEQIAALRQAAKVARVDDAYICRLAHVDALTDIHPDRYMAALNRLNRMAKGAQK